MQNSRILEIRSGRCTASESGWAHIECGSDLPQVPVLLETRLAMELKAQDRCVDLREISQLVLRDMGAVLRIFHRAAKENPSPEDRPARIEDCISNLGLQSCLEALSSDGAGSGICSSDLIETWQHAKEVAESCRQLASEPTATANPEEAHLVGLFHQLYSLPALFGWGALNSTPKAAALCGLRMAEDWSLPTCVLDYFREMENRAREQRWSRIVQSAHEMGCGSHSDETSVEI